MSHLGSATDKAILKKLQQHLARVSLGSQSHVNVAVRDGQVTLSGNLQYENQRRPALKAARSVEGVRGVLDQLRVQPPKAYGPRPAPHPARQDASQAVPAGPSDGGGPVESDTLILSQRSQPLNQPEADGPASLTGASPSVAQPQRPDEAHAARVEVDDSAAVACYANFCRVMGTPEELIIDFGLNPQPFGAPREPIAITQRIVTNLYTAKRLVHALQLTVQRYEGTFGAIETDVQKRAQHG
jgi:hypothetical protein